MVGWADRLAWVKAATDEKTGRALFPPGKFTRVKPFRRSRAGTRRVRVAVSGLLFEGANRKARRDAARSTRGRGR